MENITSKISTFIAKEKLLMPGILVASMVAIAAKFLSEHYGAPALLMALLLGIALNFLSEEGKCIDGIQFSVSYILRIGVALLGVRISVELVSMLGFKFIGIVMLGVVATLLFGLIAARFIGWGWRFGVLTGGSVAICGASAAIAISAVLPKSEHSERDLIFTILSVTVLSTIAMIAYPPLSLMLNLSGFETGVFIGGTIHDVAQVVGAGFSVSDDTGEVATVVKLIRVAMLAPVVLVLSIAIRYMGAYDTSAGEKRPPLVPTFVLGFLACATLNSLGLIPDVVAEVLKEASRWALLIAIAAVGMKTSLRRVFEVGGDAILLIVSETVFIAVFIFLAIHYLG